MGLRYCSDKGQIDVIPNFKITRERVPATLPLVPTIVLGLLLMTLETQSSLLASGSIKPPLSCPALCESFCLDYPVPALAELRKLRENIVSQLEELNGPVLRIQSLWDVRGSAGFCEQARDLTASSSAGKPNITACSS